MKKRAYMILPLLFLIALAPTERAKAGQSAAAASDQGIIWPRKNNPLHAVVVFTRFKDEAPGETEAPKFAKKLFTGDVGSVPHFFDYISFGQYKVTGECLPKMYEMPYDIDHYTPTAENPGSTYSKYCEDLVKILDEDPTIDFSRYDNDGPDGIPSSEDDDGYVDYLVFMPMTRPEGFILKLATGIMYLGLKEPYITQDRNKIGERIKIDRASGCVSVAKSEVEARGTIIAEICHVYGATDLMDKLYDTNNTDSAGVGFWDILGKGALGWGYYNGPVGLNALNRYYLNSIGYKNTGLVDLLPGTYKNIEVQDIGRPEGQIYRIPIRDKEYFLIEFRDPSGPNYYDRQLPKQGLSIWHVLEGQTNSLEELKLCDMECPDGRYLDKGYPQGEVPDAVKGGDNLDFWAHDPEHSRIYGGNAGDATDVFDGVVYTRFGTNTNPNTYSKVTKKPTGIEIYNIRPGIDESGHAIMLFDCSIPGPDIEEPPITPNIGLAFQRTGQKSPYDQYTSINAVYLVHFGIGVMPDMMLIANDDSLTINELSFEAPYQAEKAAHMALFKSEYDALNTQIVSSVAQYADLTAMLDSYGVPLETVTGGRAVITVRKLIATTKHEAAPVTGLVLYQNHPNPFNGETTITYQLETGGEPELEVFNITGQRIMNLNHGYRAPGLHRIHIDLAQFPTGVYLYRLKSGQISQTRKFTVIK